MPQITVADCGLSYRTLEVVFEMSEIESETIDVTIPPMSGGTGNQNLNQTVTSTLIFGSATFETLEDGIHPRFSCPGCGRPWQPQLVFGDLSEGTYDFNNMIYLTIPEHDSCSFGLTKINLYFAVHREGSRITCCFQKSSEEGENGIDENWWIK